LLFDRIDVPTDQSGFKFEGLANPPALDCKPHMIMLDPQDYKIGAAIDS
jgi:hypothetical protein